MPIESYGHYAGQPLSRCFALDLRTERAAAPGSADRQGAAGPGPGAVAGAPVAGAVVLRAVPWEDPDATALRREMHETSSAVLYPELFEGLDAAGGFEAVDARLGTDVVLTLVAYRDDEALGCASLRRPSPARRRTRSR